MTTNTTQTVFTEVIHVVAQGIVWTVPLLFLAFPHWGDLTLSAAGSMLIAYLRVKYLSN